MLRILSLLLTQPSAYFYLSIYLSFIICSFSVCVCVCTPFTSVFYFGYLQVASVCLSTNPSATDLRQQQQQPISLIKLDGDSFFDCASQDTIDSFVKKRMFFAQLLSASSEFNNKKTVGNSKGKESIEGILVVWYTFCPHSEMIRIQHKSDTCECVAVFLGWEKRQFDARYTLEWTHEISINQNQGIRFWKQILMAFGFEEREGGGGLLW